MRGIALLVMFASTLAHGAWNEYVETRDLRLDARGISTLEIDAGAGGLTVKGDPGITEIVVAATITVPEDDEDKAQAYMEKSMVLTLDRDNDAARLRSYFESGLFSWGQQGSVSLDVTLPQSLSLVIDDGSGSIEISDVGGSLFVDDGSGGIRILDNGGDVEIDDGSGGILVAGAAGNVRITDGSGSMTIERVAGSVYVDDGSGSIDVSDVLQDLIVEDDGSGGIDHDGVLGQVIIDQ